MSQPYLVSLSEDMQNPVEVFSASGHEHAAELAQRMGSLPSHKWHDYLYVQSPSGEICIIEQPEPKANDSDETTPEELL